MQTYMKELSHLGPVGPLFGGLGKRWLLIAGCWMLTVASTWGQNASLEVMGSLEHEESKSTLVNATVRVLQAGEPFDQVEVDRNGRYFLDLPLRGDYMLVFESEGTIAKRVQVDGTVIPEDMGLDGFRLELDMALFDEMDGFDESILETPIGIAVFDIDSEKIEFDLRHTAEMRRKIDKEMDRLADAADDLRRNQMRYENAIEDAERAVARKRWDDAKLEYEKALKFLPGDAAAVAGLAQVQGELDAIAAAEAAERQAELDAAKAEEDERLAAEASERLEAEAAAAEAAAQEEEARLAAEQLAAEEAERLAAEEAQRIAEEEAAAEVVEEEAEEVWTPPVVEDVEQDSEADDNAAKDAALQAQQDALKAKEEERRALKEAKEAERKARQDQAKSRANAMSQGAGSSTDPAEEYYRQALESELQARAAGVRDLGSAAKARNNRLTQESSIRAGDAQRQSRSIQVGQAPDAGSSEGFRGGPSGAAASGAALRASAASEVETLKASEDTKRQRNQSLMANQAQSVMIDLEGVVGYDPSMRTGSVLSAEDADIPQGVHETSYDIQNGLVITRTVRVDDVVTRYRKVVMKTGTYYFCGDKSITRAVWNLETNLSYD